MALLKYTGQSDVRELSAHAALVFNEDNNMINEVDDEVAQTIMQNCPGEFAILVEQEQPTEESAEGEEGAAGKTPEEGGPPQDTAPVEHAAESQASINQPATGKTSTT